LIHGRNCWRHIVVICDRAELLGRVLEVVAFLKVPLQKVESKLWFIDFLGSRKRFRNEKRAGNGEGKFGLKTIFGPRGRP